ncbi:hypothetical protein SYJ56_04980 [Algoriphagus sp. D3-2-R+10]|uniref:hypothetical protein n=1 Tax=Algoriphagus aurantiacus TaxID=3103948 RepID=UPI002B393137|nr:hypothetical protein [Algoriphagus sp. D3-2-R+10]MEB2774648.1 hypothetical protein [Algoriphagus sp. D3-2-R+10]
MIRNSLLAIVLFLGSISLFGQTNTFPASGNVGIGTLSPVLPLHVKTTGANRVRFEFGGKTIDLVSYGTTSEPYGSAAGVFMSGQDGLIMTGAGNNLRFITNNGGYAERMRILANGNIGIGTSSPSHKLHVVGSGRFNGSASSYTEINSNASGAYMWQYNAAGNLSWVIRGYAATYQAEFRHGGISVNGTIKTNEVNVTATGWADYVFDDSYSLKPLEEVQKFYQTNGHLENIPTEKEVLENGVNLSEMTVKLLEKVEELTIYLVKQNSRIIDLQAELESLKSIQ